MQPAKVQPSSGSASINCYSKIHIRQVGQPLVVYLSRIRVLI